MKNFLFIKLVFIFVFTMTGVVSAQKQIEQQIQRDPVLEADSKHNLDVARQYFKLKKAYKAVILRFEETYAANPAFSNMDEFLFYAGMSSYYLSIGKGKQKIISFTDEEKKRFAPARLREEAIAYLSMISRDYPQSQYVTPAKKALAEIEPKAK